MIEVLRQMVEALEYWDVHGKLHQPTEEAIQAGKQAIAELESQEPVAWGVFEGNLHDMFFTQEEAQEMARLKGSHAEVKPLYTHPPQRKPLTLGQKQRLWSSVGEKTSLKDRVNAYGFAIEVAHGIRKNI